MNNLRMRTKLSLGFGLVLLLTCFIGVVAMYCMRTISNDSVFLKEAVMPQTAFAIRMDSQLRASGLNIRKFAASGEQQNWQATRAALDAVNAGVADTVVLSRAQPRLIAAESFVTAIPEPLAAFEKSCNAIRDARETMTKTIAIIRTKGPETNDVLNELIDFSHAEMAKMVDSGDITAYRHIFSRLDVYNNMYDIVENLRRDIFIALTMNDRSVLTAVIQGFSEPAESLRSLLPQLKDDPGTREKIERTLAAFSSLEAATNSLVTAVDLVNVTDVELVRSYNSALRLVDNLVSDAARRNDEITAELNADATSAVWVVCVVLAVALLFGLGMTVWLTTNITGQLVRFAKAAKKLGEGQFETRVDVLSRDEIGITASAINKAFDVVVDKVLWYEAILDAIPAPITVTDTNRCWTFINKAAEGHIGRARKEVQGHPCSQWGTVLCNKPTCPLERLPYGENIHTLRDKDTTFSIQVSYILDKHAQKIGHIELLRDVTELVAAQQRAESALSDGMRTAAEQLETISNKVSSVAEELSGSIQQAASGSAEQASRVTDTVDTMKDMNRTVTEVSKYAGSAAEVSASTRQKAMDGAEMVREVVTGIQVVQQDSQRLKIDMTKLGEHAQSISHIMEVISDIADQTNLLALNAAIEAARAGESGRGFAVVADEVRKLAEKTMQSTVNVGSAIKAIQHSVDTSTQQVDVAVSGIERATGLARRSGAALDEIVRMVEDAGNQVRAIGRASEEQSDSSTAINQAIAQVNSIATETAQNMRNASIGVSSLLEQTQVLISVMEEMKQR